VYSQEEAHYDQAIDLYTKAIDTLGKSSPKAAPILCNRAMCFIKTESYKLAIDDGEAAAVADPAFPKGYFRQGSGYFFLGKLPEALKIFKDVEELFT